MRALVCVVMISVACGKKGEDANPAIPLTFVEHVQVGKVMKVTVSTTPGTRLYAYADRGETTPKEQIVEASGKATIEVTQAWGDNKLMVQTSLPDSTRKGTEYKLSFSLTDPDAKPIVVEDPNLKWSVEGSRRFINKPGDEFKVTGSTLTIKLMTRQGNEIQLEDAKATAGAGPVELTADFSAAVRRTLAAQKIDGESKSFVLAIVPMNVVITGKDGKKKTDTLSLDGQSIFVEWLEALSKGPLLLDGEKSGASARRSAIVAFRTSNVILGDPKSFADIDLVALETWESREKRCGPYSNEKGRDATYIDLRMWDKSVRLWDRRAGKQLGKRDFRAPGICPKTIHASDTKSSTDVPEDTVTKWVAGFVKK